MSPLPAVAQLLYGSDRARSHGASGGWQVLDCDPEMSAAEREAVIALVPSQLEQPRRMAYHCAGHGGSTVLVHSVSAGPDITGRPGNVLTHAVLDRNAAARLGEVGALRPIELWGSPSWKVAATYEEVSAARLDEWVPTPGAEGLTSRSDVTEWLAGSPLLTDLGMVLSAAAQYVLDDRGDWSVVLLVDNVADGVRWLAAVSQLGAPHGAPMLTFTTHQSARRVLDNPTAFALNVVLRDDRDVADLRRSPHVVLLDLGVGAIRRDGDSWVCTTTGAQVAHHAWSELACRLAAGNLGDYLAIADGYAVRHPVDADADPWWPLAHAVLDDPLWPELHEPAFELHRQRRLRRGRGRSTTGQRRSASGDEGAAALTARRYLQVRPATAEGALEALHDLGREEFTVAAELDPIWLAFFERWLDQSGRAASGEPLALESPPDAASPLGQSIGLSSLDLRCRSLATAALERLAQSGRLSGDPRALVHLLGELDTNGMLPPPGEAGHEAVEQLLGPIVDAVSREPAILDRIPTAADNLASMLRRRLSRSYDDMPATVLPYFAGEVERFELARLLFSSQSTRADREMARYLAQKDELDAAILRTALYVAAAAAGEQVPAPMKDAPGWRLPWTAAEILAVWGATGSLDLTLTAAVPGALLEGPDAHAMALAARFIASPHAPLSTNGAVIVDFWATVLPHWYEPKTMGYQQRWDTAAQIVIRGGRALEVPDVASAARQRIVSHVLTAAVILRTWHGDEWTFAAEDDRLALERVRHTVEESSLTGRSADLSPLVAAVESLQLEEGLRDASLQELAGRTPQRAPTMHFLTLSAPAEGVQSSLVAVVLRERFAYSGEQFVREWFRRSHYFASADDVDHKRVQQLEAFVAGGAGRASGSKGFKINLRNRHGTRGDDA